MGLAAGSAGRAPALRFDAAAAWEAAALAAGAAGALGCRPEAPRFGAAFADIRALEFSAPEGAGGWTRSSSVVAPEADVAGRLLGVGAAALGAGAVGALSGLPRAPNWQPRPPTNVRSNCLRPRASAARRGRRPSCRPRRTPRGGGLASGPRRLGPGPRRGGPASRPPTSVRSNFRARGRRLFDKAVASRSAGRRGAVARRRGRGACGRGRGGAVRRRVRRHPCARILRVRGRRLLDKAVAGRSAGRRGAVARRRGRGAVARGRGRGAVARHRGRGASGRGRRRVELPFPAAAIGAAFAGIRALEFSAPEGVDRPTRWSSAVAAKADAAGRLLGVEAAAALVCRPQAPRNSAPRLARTPTRSHVAR